MLMQTKGTHSITNVRQSQFVFVARALSTTSWAACHAMTFFQSSICTSPAFSVLSRSPKNNGPKGHQCQSFVPARHKCGGRFKGALAFGIFARRVSRIHQDLNDTAKLG